MDDYESPAAMAEHLNYLMDHPDEYMSYFAWRQQGLTRVKNPRDWIGRFVAASKAAAETVAVNLQTRTAEKRELNRKITRK